MTDFQYAAREARYLTAAYCRMRIGKRTAGDAKRKLAFYRKHRNRLLAEMQAIDERYYH